MAIQDGATFPFPSSGIPFPCQLLSLTQVPGKPGPWRDFPLHIPAPCWDVGSRRARAPGSDSPSGGRRCQVLERLWQPKRKRQTQHPPSLLCFGPQEVWGCCLSASPCPSNSWTYSYILLFSLVSVPGLYFLHAFSGSVVNYVEFFPEPGWT